MWKSSLPFAIGGFCFECCEGFLKSVSMDSSNYRVRRATLDDISALMVLWQSMHLSAADLSKRITEFQIAESAEGGLLGAVGLQMAERQGLIHSEAFSDFALAEQLRPMLWDRIHVLATNHGLLRLWTHEKAPFWNHCGMIKADAEALEKLPAAWGDQSAGWLTLKLREDLETVVSLDREFAMFMESEKQRTQRAFRHARILKAIASLLAFVVFALILGVAFYLFRKNPHLFGR